MKSSIIKGIVLAGLCLAVPAYLSAAEEQSGSQAGSQQGETHMHHEGMHQGTNQVSAQNPTDLNRASKLIGMELVNQQNKKLGTIRDLIVDPKSQRVAYAWVEKSAETGNTGKYLAVPINVFSPSSQDKHLILNADKAQFDSAKGYAKNQMPNMALPHSQTAFWENFSEAAGAQSGQGKSQPKPKQ